MALQANKLVPYMCSLIRACRELQNTQQTSYAVKGIVPSVTWRGRGITCSRNPTGSLTTFGLCAHTATFYCCRCTALITGRGHRATNPRDQWTAGGFRNGVALLGRCISGHMDVPGIAAQPCIQPSPILLPRHHVILHFPWRSPQPSERWSGAKFKIESM